MYQKIARHYAEDERDCSSCKYENVPQVNVAVSAWKESVTVYGEPCSSCKRTKNEDERCKAPDMWEPKPTKQTASEIVEEVKGDICDKYCRYPQQLGELELEFACAVCPLNRL